jgi:hypothetical protein
MEEIQSTRFRGLHLGVLAVIFATLFIYGLSYVINFNPGMPHFPNPYDPPATVTAYFQQHPHDVLMCMFFQFVSAIPLGIFTVTVWTRLKWLGVNAVGPSIALLGGLLVVTALIPLTRFPGFVWLMIAGFMLAARKAPARSPVGQRLMAQAAQ